MSYYSYNYKGLTNPPKIIVIFHYNENIIFQSHNEEFLSSLIYKFRSKINDYKTNFQFYINNRELKDSKKNIRRNKYL